MEISKEIMTSHNNLSGTSVKFLKYLKKNPEALIRSNFSTLFEMHDEPNRIQPWPVFINQNTKSEIKEASETIFNIIRTIPKRFFSNDPTRISEFFHLPIKLVHYCLNGVNDKHIKNLLGRGDFIWTSEGLKLIEYNITSGLGGWQWAPWVREYLKISVIAKFLQDNQVKIEDERLFSSLFSHLIKNNLEKFFIYNELNIAITVSELKIEDEVWVQHLNHVYKKTLHRFSANLKGDIFLCYYTQLDFDGKNVTYGDLKVHTILEFQGGYVPFNMLIAFKMGKVLIFNGSSSGLFSNKLNLAILSENEDSPIFTFEERNTIKNYVPWTRKIADTESHYQGKKINLKDFIISNREKLIMKPGIGFGGNEILLGKRTPAKDWEQKVEKVLKEKNWKNFEIDSNYSKEQWHELKLNNFNSVQSAWTVQEYIESVPYLFQYGENGCTEHNAVWGFFVFGSSYAGGFVRILPVKNNDRVINIHQGAQKAMIFEIDE